MKIQSILKALPIALIAGLAAYSLKISASQNTVKVPSANFEMPANNPDIPPGLKEYEVVEKSIHDGDTLRVRSPELGTVLKIRFACIDAPELKQPLGEESRNYLRSLVNRGGNKVKVQPITVDRYGRTVAQLWNNQGLLNSQMAGAGMAYKYDQYKKDCPNWPAVESMEAQAQEEKLGVWESIQQKPWDYRKSKR